MLDPDHKARLFRALDQNRCVLFLGAGFSADARNAIGEPIPMAEALASQLWRWADLPGEYDPRSRLPVVYDAVLASGKPLSALRQFLEARLLATELSPWQLLVPRIFWYRIYGTNVDDVVEKAFRDCESELALETISAPIEGFRERDQFLRRVQYVKLHGSLPGDPRHLTFGTLAFGRRANAQDDWWHHFVRDHVFQPTIFVGTQIDEPLFWQAIAARESRGDNPEQRPDSYLVLPDLPAANAALLRQYNITHIPAYAAAFFTWLEREYAWPDRASVLRNVAPEEAALLLSSGASERTRSAWLSFLAVFERVPVPKARPERMRLFFRGVPPTWDDIAAGFDAPREFTMQLQEQVTAALRAPGGQRLFALLGEGGSGKSTILRRLAFNLRLAGEEVFYSDGSARVDARAARQALDSLERKALLVIDNANLLGPTLAELLEELRKAKSQPVTLLGARYIPFEHRLKAALDEQGYAELDVPPLSDVDIGNLLVVLEDFNQLGHLAQLSEEERRYEFKHRARSKILVALREATEGRGFDDIMRSEYSEIQDSEPRLLFLSAALATASLVDMTERQLLECGLGSPSETLRIIRRDLRGMFEVYGRERLVTARHPVVAEYILNNVASRAEVMEAYRRVLLSIARDIYGGVGRRTRAWRLLVRLINHQAVYERFGSDIQFARGVFELTSDAYADEGHFWLQYANLEIDYGLASYARGHLANAEGLLGETDLVINTRAHMMLREALLVSNYEEALRLRHEAEEILLEQMEKASSEDEYPFHVYLTHVLGWIRAWAPNVEVRREQLKTLLEAADRAVERMPRNRKLRGVREVVLRDYMLTGVAGEIPDG